MIYGENADFATFLDGQKKAYPWLPNEVVSRYARDYGTRMGRILEGASCLQDLGEDLGGTLYGAEVDYLIDQEFAQSAADILWRRSKLGLHVPEGTAERLTAYLAKVPLQGAASAPATEGVKA